MLCEEADCELSVGSVWNSFHHGSQSSLKTKSLQSVQQADDTATIRHYVSLQFDARQYFYTIQLYVQSIYSNHGRYLGLIEIPVNF